MAAIDQFPFDGRKVAWGAIGTLGGVLLIFVAVFYLLFAEPQGPSVPQRPDYAQTREEMSARTDHELKTYGWVDRQAGIARIPAELAAQQWIEQRQKDGR